MTLSAEKTHITHIDDGFDFLGFNVRKYSGRLLIKPSRKSIKTFVDGIRALIKSNPTINTESLIRLLNAKLRGWANYYRHVVSKRIYCWVDTAIFQAIYRWTRRRHPNKGALWIFNKYYKQPAPNNWWFHAKTRTVDGHADMFRLIRMASTKIVRHVKAIADATPYDPAYIAYFERRKRQRLSFKHEEVWLPIYYSCCWVMRMASVKA